MVFRLILGPEHGRGTGLVDRVLPGMLWDFPERAGTRRWWRRSLSFIPGLGEAEDRWTDDRGTDK